MRGMTFPLTFEVYETKTIKRRHISEQATNSSSYDSRTQMMGFKFKLVLADSLYGESDSNFVSVLCSATRLCGSNSE